MHRVRSSCRDEKMSRIIRLPRPHFRESYFRFARGYAAFKESFNTGNYKVGTYPQFKVMKGNEGFGNNPILSTQETLVKQTKK